MLIDDMTDELDLRSAKDSFIGVYGDFLVSQTLEDGSHIS
jgi:hypothetical protein